MTQFQDVISLKDQRFLMMCSQLGKIGSHFVVFLPIPFRDNLIIVELIERIMTMTMTGLEDL